MANKFEKEFLFKGLRPTQESRKYWECNRVSDEEDKVVVNISRSSIFQTKYGYGLIVGQTKVVWVKSWQVLEENWYTPSGTKDVVLTKDYYKVVDSTREFSDISVGDCASDSEFEKANGYHSWEDMVSIARAQKEIPVKF